jgi:hypothetical protein
MLLDPFARPLSFPIRTLRRIRFNYPVKTKRLQIWYNIFYGAIMAKQQKVLKVKETEVHLVTKDEQDYISLTDMVRPFGDESMIQNWMRNRDTIEFLGLWEHLHNPNFKPLEFEGFKNAAGSNRFLEEIGGRPIPQCHNYLHVSILHPRFFFFYKIFH